jgi:hypothetical protein
MHEADNAATGATHVFDETFVAYPRDYLLAVLVLGFEHAHLTGRNAVWALGSFRTGIVDLWLKCLECRTGKVPELDFAQLMIIGKLPLCLDA